MSASHPVGLDRIQGLCAAFNESSGVNVAVECETKMPDGTLRKAFVDATTTKIEEVRLPEDKKTLVDGETKIRVVDVAPS